MLMFLIVLILTTIMHEFLHTIIFLIQGIKISGLGFLCMHVHEKKFSFSLNINNFAYVLIESSTVTNQQSLELIIRKIFVNLIITSSAHMLMLIISLFAVFYYELDLIFIEVNISLIIVNALFLLGSFDNKRGDLKLALSFKNDISGFISLLCYSDLLATKHNNFLFKYTLGHRHMITKGNYTLEITNYLVELILFNYNIININIIDKLISENANENQNWGHIAYKYLIYRFILTGEFLVLINLENNQSYKEKILLLNKKRINSKKINENELYLDRYIGEKKKEFILRKRKIVQEFNKRIGE